jgi:RecJ-like exonuclease
VQKGKNNMKATCAVCHKVGEIVTSNTCEHCRDKILIKIAKRDKEKKYCDFVIKEFEKNGLKIFYFSNTFKEKDVQNMESLFEQVLKK